MRGITWERTGRAKSGNMYKGPMDKDWGVERNGCGRLGQVRVWGTIPSLGNVAQPSLGKASGEQGWQAGPTFMDRFSGGKSGLHCT